MKLHLKLKKGPNQVRLTRPILLNKICKITNISCYWNVVNFEENISITVGSDTVTFKKGFWDFESISKKLEKESVVLKSILNDSTCSIFHETKDINLKKLGPYLGFPVDKTISLDTTEISPKSVDIFKGLNQIELKANFVHRNKNLDQGDWSNLLTRIPIDTKQILNGTITVYQPWSSSPVYQNEVSYLDFDVKDNSTLTDCYTLFVEIEFF